MHIFSLGSPYGIHACEALAKSTKGQFHRDANPPKQKGPIAVWGQIRGAKELLEGHSDFYRLDHAYIGRNDYYRITKRDFQPSKIVERPADRWERLKSYYALEVLDWVKGNNIVLALNMPGTYGFFGIDDWGKKTEAEIKKYTNRKVIVRHRKETRPLKQDLKDAHCLVTWASNSVIDSLIAGVPVIPLGPSIARPMSHCDLSQIEAPLYPEREPFFRHMAYCQFKKDEFASGFALKTAEETWAGATPSLLAA